jgi:hypothetical protein
MFDGAVPSGTEPSPQVEDWYLGIHLGAHALSAVLTNRQTHHLYPVYWVSMSQSQPQSRRFRLPTAVYLSRSRLSSPSSSSNSRNRNAAPTTPSGFVPLAIGTLAQSLASLAPASEGSGQRMLLEQIHQHIGQPTLTINAEFPLQPADVTFALQILLSTLSPAASDRHVVTSTVQSEAGGLSTTAFHTALQRLSGVGVVCSENWNRNQYQAIAQAILDTKLVEHADQIDFVDEAIAALRSVLHDPERPLTLADPAERPDLGNQAWSGPCLVVVRGGSLLHLAITTLSTAPIQLKRQQILIETLPMDDQLKRMVEHLHATLTDLLYATTLQPTDIQHVLYADEVEPSPAIAHWLKKQYPHATYVGDGDRPTPRTTSRLAYGAAIQGFYGQAVSVED